MFSASTFSSHLLAIVLVSSKLATAQSTGTFDFLTYNIAGLPAFLSDNGVPGDKGTNAGIIGTKLAERAYDIVHLQEDFNYHAYVYATDNHPYRTATTGGVPFGSGLNTVANFPWSAFQQVKWDRCWVNEADCLTPKGFSFMRMQVADGVEVDLYSLHADAGGDRLDIEARRSGIEQMLSFIHTNSQGRAIIIGGDTNDRYTNADLSINLLTEAGFTDTWIEVVKAGQFPVPGSSANECPVPSASNDCEIVDKVLYRSGSAVQLSALDFSYEADVFLQPDGNKVSDHNPIHVQFAYSTT